MDKFSSKIYYLIQVIERFEPLFLPNQLASPDIVTKKIKRNFTRYERYLFELLNNKNTLALFTNKEFQILLKLKQNCKNLKQFKYNLIRFRLKNYIDFNKQYVIDSKLPINNKGIDLLLANSDTKIFNNNYSYVYLNGTRCYQNKKVLALINNETKELVAAYCNKIYPDKEILGWHTKDETIIEEKNLCM